MLSADLQYSGYTDIFSGNPPSSIVLPAGSTSRTIVIPLVSGRNEGRQVTVTATASSNNPPVTISQPSLTFTTSDTVVNPGKWWRHFWEWEKLAGDEKEITKWDKNFVLNLTLKTKPRLILKTMWLKLSNLLFSILVVWIRRSQSIARVLIVSRSGEKPSVNFTKWNFWISLLFKSVPF